MRLKLQTWLTCSCRGRCNSASYKLLKLWFQKFSSVNVKACSLSLKLVHYYIANCRTFKMAIIFISNASKMKPFYISKEMTRGRLFCAMNCRRKPGSYSVFYFSSEAVLGTVWSCASKCILSLGETEDECVLQTT